MSSSNLLVVGDAIFWIAAAVIFLAQMAILRSVAVAGRPGDRERRASELAWAVLPALVLAATLVLTWRALQ